MIWKSKIGFYCKDIVEAGCEKKLEFFERVKVSKKRNITLFGLVNCQSFRE